MTTMQPLKIVLLCHVDIVPYVANGKHRSMIEIEDYISIHPQE